MNTLERVEDRSEAQSAHNTKLVMETSELLPSRDESSEDSIESLGFGNLEITGMSDTGDDTMQEKDASGIDGDGEDRRRERAERPAEEEDGRDLRRQPADKPVDTGSGGDSIGLQREGLKQNSENGKDEDKDKINPDQCDDIVKPPTEEDLWESLKNTHGRMEFDQDGNIVSGEGLKGPLPQGPIQVEGKELCGDIFEVN